MKWKRGQRYGALKTEVVGFSDGHAGRAIITVWTHQPTTDCNKVEPWPEGEANLNLVVAAPEVLEELEHCVVALEYAAEALGELGEDDDANMIEKQAKSARAAIAKAKGKS